jgi:hypothetical protein
MAGEINRDFLVYEGALDQNTVNYTPETILQTEQ